MKKIVITRKTNWLLGICALLVFTVSPVKAYFYSGNDLVELKRESEKTDKIIARADAVDVDWVKVREYMAYILGVFDATRSQYDVPDGATKGQMVSVVTKYFNEHPEEWAEPAAEFVKEALRKAFPAKGSR